jgi:hypothetical protein
VLVGIVLVVLPTTVLMLSLGDSVLGFVVSVRDNTLRIPASLDLPAERAVDRLMKLMLAMIMMRTPIRLSVHKVGRLVTWSPRLPKRLSK